MKISDKQYHGFLLGGLIILALIVLLWWRNKNVAPAPAQAANQTLDNSMGPSGSPIAPQFQYGQQNPFQINLADYNVPIPQFHYAGNASIYMPMFGFVGYGAQPL